MSGQTMLFTDLAITGHHFGDPFHNQKSRTNQSSVEAKEKYDKSGKCERDRQNLINYLLQASPERPLTMRELKHLTGIDDVGTVSARLSEIRNLAAYKLQHTTKNIDGRKVGAWYLERK
jgi:hypothetical protein